MGGGTAPDLRNGRAIAGRVFQWALFGVIFGTLPLIVRFVTLLMSSGDISAVSMLGDGELLISSAAISAGALGEVFFATFDERTRIQRTTVGFMSMIVCICTSVAYVQAKVASPEVVVNASLILFAATLCVAATCVSMAVGR